MNKFLEDEEHEDGESCSCPKCLEECNKEMESFRREYRLYRGEDDEGNIIDVRTNEIVIKKQGDNDE